MLYIVSTPIGHLSDISLRALEVLASVDMILCEDTRVSKTLLNAHKIHTPLSSYHSFNEKKRLDEIIDRLKEGQSLALISDAGTPLIQDPGFILIQRCQKEHIPYTTVPGASSVMSALILSGYPIERFQFIGFLPKKSQEAKKTLIEACSYNGLSLLFESPKRALDTLTLIHNINPDLSLCVIREITKKFETVHKGTAESLLKEFSLTAPRGELVFVIQGKPSDEVFDATQIALELTLGGLSKKSAFNLASKLGFVDKNRLYQS